jgi:hypothetical protein
MRRPDLLPALLTLFAQWPWCKDLGLGSRWLHQVNAAQAQSKSSTKLLSLLHSTTHKWALRLTPPYFYKEGNLCAGDPVNHHHRLRTECTSSRTTRKLRKKRNKSNKEPVWRSSTGAPSLLRITAWRIEVAPVRGLSNVATPHKSYHHHPNHSIYGYGNGDDR